MRILASQASLHLFDILKYSSPATSSVCKVLVLPGIEPLQQERLPEGRDYVPNFVFVS